LNDWTKDWSSLLATPIGKGAQVLFARNLGFIEREKKGIVLRVESGAQYLWGFKPLYQLLK